MFVILFLLQLKCGFFFGWFADGAGFVVGAGKGVSCLRAVLEADMIKASKAFYATLKAPLIGLGVVIDGNLVSDFPPYLVAQGRFHKNITILSSNDNDEVYMPPPCQFVYYIY